MQKVVLASSNQGKLNELSTLFEPLGIDLVSQQSLGIESAEETESTFLGNALLKARHASCEANLPAIADDSGIEVDALGGDPGVFSARYAGPHANATDNNAKLVEALSAIDPSFKDFVARFHCVLVFVRSAMDEKPLIAEGVWEGRIVKQARGENGFGYDPHFFVLEEGCTAAQLSNVEKNQLSHRGQAVRRMIELLTEFGASN